MIRNPAPLDRDVVLSPAWLTEALGERYPGAEIASVNIVEVLQTQATKIRFAVDYKDRSFHAPRAFCVKALLGPEPERLLAAGISEVETRFYQEIAPSLSIEVPTLVYGAVDPQTRHGLIIMEDVVAAGGRFLTALVPYSIEQAAATLDQLARLHAKCWHEKGLDRYSWLSSRLQMIAAKSLIPVERLQELLRDPRGNPLPKYLNDAQAVYGLVQQLARWNASQPNCLVHGDCHAGNLYENNGGPGIVDWQMLGPGHWAQDVAYHIGAVLSVEDRRASEQVLLRLYLESLRSQNIDVPEWEDAWREYRAQMIYGFYMWAVTRFVEPRITYEFVRRLGLAVDDLETVKLLNA